MEARESSEMKIQDLEENIKTLTQRAVEREADLERFDLLHLLLLLGSHK